MEKSPWIWALKTPSKSDGLEIWLDDDKDRVVRDAYDEMNKRLVALRAADNLMKLRNEVYDKYRSEAYRSELEVVSELNALEERVRKHIATEDVTNRATKNDVPDQLPDPTSLPVTPPAGVGGAPSVAADH